ncbi:MAG TPA: translation elongation factor Ts [Clostridia bacterium]|jgi:elongation factor Ts|nr:translation elongation factor Ts [Clostridia bacterium]HPA60329.1 translation elongation factor Ts [Clostridia bacterium]HPY43336.1 translation elongation factor Ts [Clostridia bacterium]HQA97362.1 translation elongation factor Ts [Clostridia bacterium]HQO55347.1 translation elongation factor Ts [Clostridia bacterium]
MEITAAMVKELRERTQAGMMDCKNALIECKGNMDKAIEYLREKGLAANAKKAGRIAAEGLVDSYIHMGGKIGVLLEVNCETDFVAKTDAFKDLCHDLTLQIAASNPLYISKADVPAEDLEKEREILRAQALNEGKPEKIVERMVEGRIEKYYKEVCLLEQPFVKNPDITVQALVNETALASGEKISVRRFTRYERGEGIEKKVSDLAGEIEAMTGKA